MGRDYGKNSYERRVCKSVDYKNPSKVISQNSTQNKIHETKG